MAEVTFNLTPATPQKRQHEDSASVNNSTTAPVTSQPTHGSPSRHGSPAPSTSSSLTELTFSNETPGSAVKSSASDGKGPSSKKRKLGFIEAQAEKAAKQREKEEKSRQRADEKARKDDEKRKAAEEKEAAKRAKELDRAEKQKARDEEKQKKDSEKALKDAQKAQKEAEKREKKARKEAEEAKQEAEKLKKERSQMRLGAFFAKPKSEDTPPSTPEDVSEGTISRRSSIASIDLDRPTMIPRKAAGPANPDYESFILPFFVPEHTDLAPANRFKLIRQVDWEVTPDSDVTVRNLRETFGRPQKRLKKTVPVKDVIKSMQATGLDVIEIDTDAYAAIAQAPYKCLQFREDVRPPYQGTYTRVVSPRTSRKISRNPFTRGLPDTNYDYDSEAEWEPPGEDDEDLGDEDELSDADDAADDIADFLDDADDVARRKGPMTDMEPISSGLCWVGEVFDDRIKNLEQYRMDFLSDATKFPIDPFTTKHWSDEYKQKAAKQDQGLAAMQPPRQPLSSLSPNAPPTAKVETGIDGKPIPVPTQRKVKDSNKPLKLVEPELMTDFKKAIEGSDLTKVALIEILKKKFPQCSKDAIKDTLGAVAIRTGKKEVDKRWEII